MCILLTEGSVYIMEHYNRRQQEERERIIQRGCLVFAILAAAVLIAWLVWQRGMLVEARTEAATADLAGQVLRFHVLADSDSLSDQQIKMQVKEDVVTWLHENQPEDADRKEMEAFIREHLEDIRELAQETVRREGSSDKVIAELTRDEFPEKTYGTLTFPAGEYEALRIRIGAGEGHNWWCCLYPGLCFTDAVHVEADKKDIQELRTLVDEDAYEMVTCTSDFRIKWFFFGGHEGDK